MAEGLLGKKVGMTQVFNDKGEIIPVTVLEVGPCFVTQIKSPEKDGYSAIQMGFGETRRLNKPERGHLKQTPSLKYLREVRTSSVANYQVGNKLNISLFNVGDLVDVSGVSKGKGHAGVVKRHHFKGGSVTHGQSDRLRRGGSSGATTTPGRVLKGLRMAGQLGNKHATVLNIEVIQVDQERNLLAIKGTVPGAKGSLVFVRKARKEKRVPKAPPTSKKGSK